MEELWNCPICSEYIDIDTVPSHNRYWHNHQKSKRQSNQQADHHDPAYRDGHSPHEPTRLPKEKINLWMSHKDRTTKSLNIQKVSEHGEDEPVAACQTCGQAYHCSCITIPVEESHNFICCKCQPPAKKTPRTYLTREENDPPFMTKPEFAQLCHEIKKIQSKGPATLGHRYNFRHPTTTWELLAGSSAHSYACAQAGYPAPSVVVERTKACDPVLRANCGPTLHHIFRFIQAGHPDSMPLPSHYAYHYLKMRSRSKKEKGRKHSRHAEKYTLDLMIACLICTPYSRMGLQHGFNQGAGRAFCEILRLLADTPTNVGMTEQCTEFTTSESGKVFSLFLNCLTSMQYEVAWRVHNTSDGGMPQDRKRVYIIYIKKPGPSPDFLMDLDLSPTDEFKQEQQTLNGQREFPTPARLVQFPLHQTKYTMPVRTDGKTGAILTGPRRTAFAAQHHVEPSDNSTPLVTLSGPIHVANLLSLQELPQNHLSAAPSLNAQYSDIGNSCSGEIALQQLRQISAAVDLAAQRGRSSYTPQLTPYTKANQCFRGSLAECIEHYCKSPTKYRGACTDLEGRWALFPKCTTVKDPICTLTQAVTKLPIGTRRELDATNITYLTPKEAAHILYRSMDTLSAHPWLLNHLFLAAGQAYEDRLSQPDKEPVDRHNDVPPEFEDINEWTQLFMTILQQH